ncbi:ATP-binding protein [Pararhodobacter sp.]|uniref:ATP-binding protein n=1 Tax=Pararhodobacter sp. TaxID=2127056 RepID=UPI002B002F02|nr:ATP-binding protein [Pararhodobacter sp.]
MRFQQTAPLTREGSGVLPNLIPDIENRVRKLPKPATYSQALQPLFEAVSNALYAIEDREAVEAGHSGQVKIDIYHLSDPSKFRVEIADNGIGLDSDRYKAFQTIDTDFKRKRGGKGVGRLFWLDAFEHIRVESAYLEGDELKQRCFSFALCNEEQIVELELVDGYDGRKEVGTTIVCEGLRGASYQKAFPKQRDTFLRYFSAHFIADFLVGGGASVHVNLDGDFTSYPEAVADLVVDGDLKTGAFEIEDYGTFSIDGFACEKEASTGLDGNHQLHLLANGRTVETRKVDGLMGLATVSANGRDDLLFHGCVSSEYLDERVNEGRTAFNLPESILKEISRKCVEHIRVTVLADQMEGYIAKRRSNYDEFVSRHPIYGFEDPEVQLDRVPFNAQTPEQFATGLVKYQIRRDEDRQNAIEDVITLLNSGDDVTESFATQLQAAVEGVQSSEQLALAQHVVRRKLVLDLMGKLLNRVRIRDGKHDDFHLEKTLHSFIVPMYVMGNDAAEKRPRAHDLWILDERLAFTRAFSSDKRFDALMKSSDNHDRSDLVVWDFASGLGVIDPYRNDAAVDTSQPLDKVMIVEFKKPGRTHYGPEDQIHFQITKYIDELRGGEIEGFERQRIRISPDCVFYCYVVADIEGDLKRQLSTWSKSANGQGRFMPLQGDVNGSIEVIQWQDLVNDAWARNEATLYAARLQRG